MDEQIAADLAAHQAEISAYVGSLMPGDPSIGDVVQRTNLVVWKKRSSFKKGTNFRAWMYAIAHLEVRAHYKECKRKSWLVVDETLAKQITATMMATAESQTMDELRIALESCLKKLQPGERELIEHRYYSEQPLHEYARSQGRSTGSLKTALFRIRAALKGCIERHLPPESATSP